LWSFFRIFLARSTPLLAFGEKLHEMAWSNGDNLGLKKELLPADCAQSPGFALAHPASELDRLEFGMDIIW